MTFFKFKSSILVPENEMIHDFSEKIDPFTRQRIPEKELGDEWISPTKYTPERERIEKTIREIKFIKQPRYVAVGNYKKDLYYTFQPHGYTLRPRMKSREIHPPMR